MATIGVWSLGESSVNGFTVALIRAVGRDAELRLDIYLERPRYADAELFENETPAEVYPRAS